MKFKITHLIKDPSKNFFNLTRGEVADMIESYLSGGSDKFDHAALPEFMLINNTTPWLENVRLNLKYIDESRRTSAQPDGLATNEGKADLINLAQELRNSDN